MCAYNIDVTQFKEIIHSRTMYSTRFLQKEILLSLIYTTQKPNHLVPGIRTGQVSHKTVPSLIGGTGPTKNWDWL